MLLRNILIFHAGALGDFVLTWPLAMAAGRLFPHSRVIYVTHGQKGQLAERAIGVESTDQELGWHHLFSDAKILPDPAARRLAGAHLILSFVSTPEDAWSRIVRRLNSQAAMLLLRPRPIQPAAQHASIDLLGQLTPLPTLHEATRQILASISERGLGCRPPADGPVLIHPGSGGAGKCWSLDHFRDLARQLQSTGRPVRFLLGEVEQDRWSAGDVTALRAIAEVRQPATYLELHRELSAGRAYVGNDSGPSHLAGIMGLPTFQVFGPTDPAVWRALGPHVTVRRATTLADLSAADVAEWVLRAI